MSNIIQIQIRRDTAANWTTENVTLLSGEFGLETDTGKVKLGDGVTAWTALDYFPGATSTMILDLGANPDLVDTNVPLNVGAVNPDTSPHIEVGFSDIQSKADINTPAQLNLNLLGGSVSIGLANSNMLWDNTQLALRDTGNIFFEALTGEVNLWASDVADPTAGDSIEAFYYFLSQDQNTFGRIGYDDTDSLSITNFAYDADLLLYVTDATGNSDYGVSINSGNFNIILDVGGSAETMFDISSSTTLALSQYRVFVPAIYDFHINVLSSNPYVQLEDSSQPLDEKIWRTVIDGAGTWFLRTRNDADSSGNDAISVQRNGILVTQISMAVDGGSNIAITDDIDINGATSVNAQVGTTQVNVTATQVQIPVSGVTAFTATATEVSMTYAGTTMLRTAAAASGGVEINNTLTGGGFERALTESDLDSAITAALMLMGG